MLRAALLVSLALLAGCTSTGGGAEDLMAFGPQNGVEDMRGFHLRGTVLNRSDKPKSGVRVILEFKNEAGKVELKKETGVSPDPVPPGGTAQYFFSFAKKPKGDLFATLKWNPD